jgi:hypothetical protein
VCNSNINKQQLLIDIRAKGYSSTFGDGGVGEGKTQYLILKLSNMKPLFTALSLWDI